MSRTLKPGRKGRGKSYCVIPRQPRGWRIFLVSYTTITSIQQTNVDVIKELVEGHLRSGIATSIVMISVDEYLHLMLASIPTQSSELVQKILLVLHECRGDVVS